MGSNTLPGEITFTVLVICGVDVVGDAASDCQVTPLAGGGVCARSGTWLRPAGTGVAGDAADLLAGAITLGLKNPCKVLCPLATLAFASLELLLLLAAGTAASADPPSGFLLIWLPRSMSLAPVESVGAVAVLLSE